MNNLGPSARLLCAIIGGTVTFAVLMMFQFPFGASLILGLLVFVALWYGLSYLAPKSVSAEIAHSPVETARPTPAVSAPVLASAEVEPAAASAAKTAAAAKTAPAAKAAPKAAAKAAEAPLGTAPATLTAPRDGKADDLKIIEGVGPALEKLVNSLGFYHYDQIANWTDDEIAWVDAQMKTFKGRILRDKWQAQAKLILSEGVAAFLERAKTNNY